MVLFTIITLLTVVLLQLLFS